MRLHIVTALAFMLLLAGCDATEDDSEARRFDSAWQIVEVESQNVDYTSFVLGRYTSAVIAFNSKEDEFTILLDVADSPDDIIIRGEFRVDADDSELTLFSDSFGAFDFDYIFENENRVILFTEDDDPILEVLFDVALDLEEVILVLDRD